MAGGGDAGDDGGDPPHACGEGPVGMLEVVGRVPVHRWVRALELCSVIFSHRKVKGLSQECF